jgi:hypothetical protein
VPNKEQKMSSGGTSLYLKYFIDKLYFIKAIQESNIAWSAVFMAEAKFVLNLNTYLPDKRCHITESYTLLRAGIFVKLSLLRMYFHRVSFTEASVG